MERIEEKNSGLIKKIFSTKSKNNGSISHHNLPNWEFIIDHMGNYLNISHEVHQCLGILPEKFNNQSLFTFSIRPSSGEKIYNKFSKKEFPLEEDVTFISIDNENFTCNLKLTNFVEKYNNNTTYIGLVQVIGISPGAEDKKHQPEILEKNKDELELPLPQKQSSLEIEEKTKRIEKVANWQKPSPSKNKSISDLISEFSAEANHIIDPIDLYKLCYEVLNKIFPDENLIICSIGSESKHLEIPILKIDEDLLYFYEGVEYSSLLLEIIQKNSALVVKPQQEPDGFKSSNLDQSISYLGSSIKFRNKNFGALLVFSHEKKDFTNDDLEILQKISATMGYALENAKFFNEMQNALEAIETREKYQNQIIQSIRTISSEGLENFSKAFEILGKLTNVQRIFLANQEAESPNQKWWISHQWVSDSKFDTSHLNQSIPSDFFREYLPKLSDTGFLKIEFERLDNQYSRWFELRNSRSILVFLLEVGPDNKVLLVFEDLYQNHIWKNEEINYLKTISEILAKNLQADLIQSNLQKKWMETERFLNIVDHLGQIDLRNFPLEDRSQLIQYIQTTLAEELDAKAIIIYLENEIEPEKINPEILQVSNSIIEVMEERKPKYFLTSQSDPNFNTASILTTKIILPLIIKDIVEGAVIFIYEQKLEIDDHLIHHHKILTDHVSGLLVSFDLLKENQQLNQKILESSSLNEKFISNIGHEFRTPLNSIIGFSKVIQQGIDGPINETQKHDLALIHSSGQSLLKMINDILDLSQMETGNFQLEKTKIKIDSLFPAIIKETKEMIKEKVIEFKINHEDNLPEVYCDKERIKQVILNLISNAVKNTEFGKITLTIKKNHKGLTYYDLIFIIKDTGSGIEPVDQKDLFKAFTLLNHNEKSRTASSGLGLVISKSIINLHNGEIGLLSSSPGEGSEFYFTLPVK